MVIYTNDGKVAYDEFFHRGVNIIRGENSSGKSTISHFIFYVLGGAFNDWVKEARNCSIVYAETEMNGATITLKRNIVFNEIGRANDKEGLLFYWGKFEEAVSTQEGWLYFGYNMSSGKKSFSNVIFENLDIPIVKGDNFITFHQLLRLIYVDQESPTSSLFLYEQFDTTLTRETVADLLLGVYSQELYDKKQRLIEVEKNLEEVRSEIRVIKKFNPDPLNLIPANLNKQIDDKEAQISKLNTLIFELTNKTKQIRYGKSSKLEFEILSQNAIKQREVVKQLNEEIRNIEFEIEDTSFFISALQNKLIALKVSINTREILGEFPLDYCPECLSDLAPSEDKTICKLCKTKIDEHFGVTKARKIEQEISFQIKESTRILDTRKRLLLELQSKVDAESQKHHQLQERVNQTLNDVNSYREEKINSLYTDKGFFEGEILQLRTLLENAELYQKLLKSQSEHENEMNVLKATISKLISDQEKLKVDINTAIERVGVFLLNNDLKRQDEFFEAKKFHIDYRNNLAFISDKEAKYSASSSFYLKTSARFSIFIASLNIERMRYPRFILCDNMEDKGIEKERAQNFQRILVKELEKYQSEDYQAIYMTSSIPEEFDNPKYCVGEFYTEQNRSLKNV